ncbi:MAG: hypothetical protein JWR75_1853 [Devosia sp.]|nr:hypothetical protein [Devosia sp.]
MNPSVAKFPSYAWAWPTGGRDQLLRAAILPDRNAAAASYRDWHAAHAFEASTFTEQRLLVAISTRLGPDIPDVPERARLIGIERMMWTRSIAALKVASLGVSELRAAGLDVMVFKGAARAAIDIHDLRGRIAHDIDLLLHPTEFRRGIDTLLAAGWTLNEPGNPDTAFALDIRRGEHGKLDVHRYPLHQLQRGDAVDAGIWQRATRHQFLGQSVAVPATEDRLVIAIAHGGIDGHAHSDWLVDCARLIVEQPIDWELFVALCETRDIHAYAAIALTYLHDACAVPIPAPVLDRIKSLGRRSPTKLWGALLQARPKREHTALSTVGRGISRGIRLAKRAATLRQLGAGGTKSRG